MIDFEEPIFSTDQAAQVTRVDIDTLDNWVRYGHVTPGRVGKNRRWSIVQLIDAELLYSLAFTFKVPPKVGREIVKLAVGEYRRHLETDLLDIWSGASFATLPDSEPGRVTLSMVRTAGDVLRPFERGDSPAEAVMIILPVRLLARSVLAKAKIVMEAVATATREPLAVAS